MRKTLLVAAFLATLVLMGLPAQVMAAGDEFYVDVHVVEKYVPAGDPVVYTVEWLQYTGHGSTEISCHITEYGSGQKLDTICYSLRITWYYPPDWVPTPYDESWNMSWNSLYTDGTPVEPGHYQVHVQVKTETYDPTSRKWIRNAGAAADDFYLV